MKTALAGAAFLFSCGPSVAGPRVFSTDYCADQYAIALAVPGDIAALSPESRRDFSYLRKAAASLPQARPTLEAALGRGAEVVLRSWGGDAAAFERAGLLVVTLPSADDFEGVRRNIRSAAAALHAEERGEALVANMNARLKALPPIAGDAPSALYVTPGGVTAGRKTFVDAMFSAAGVKNAAGDQDYWPALPLESLVRRPPSFVVAGFFRTDEVGADNWSAARHPAFKAAFDGARLVHLPADVLACPAWFAADGVEAIRRAAAPL